jgi:hypothetical protein
MSAACQLDDRDAEVARLRAALDRVQALTYLLSGRVTAIEGELREMKGEPPPPAMSSDVHSLKQTAHIVSDCRNREYANALGAAR